MVADTKLKRLSKTEIVDRFRACCQKLGETPGFTRFCKLAGVRKKDVDYYWPRFSDLAKEIGVVPQEWEKKIPDSELFAEYAKVCLHLGKIPTLNELKIATRQLQTRTHSVRQRFNSIVELDRQFRVWLEGQSSELRIILDFPGWNRVLPGNTKQDATNHAALASIPFRFHPYLPSCLENLEILARGEVPSNEDPEQSAAALFERRCADAFQCLGFRIEPFGQGKGRVADFIAKADRERLALIVDAKTRSEGYNLGTEDRKFLECAIIHGRNLQAEGFDKIYLVIVAAMFRERDLNQLAAYVTNSPIRSVDLITASALIRIVEESIRERHVFALDQLDRILFGNKIIT